jgi:hypothetical protein
MRPALLLRAVMLAFCLVLDKRSPVAPHTAPAKLGIEGFQRARRQLADRHMTERWPDGAFDVAVVEVPRAVFHLAGL